MRAAADPRLGIAPVAKPRTIIIDYSAPNVAKPMHVQSAIRSTVIGADAAYNTLKFLGHDVTSDNHVGDWGTQFGMILYGYKRHFVDRAALRKKSRRRAGDTVSLRDSFGPGYFDGKEKLPELHGARQRQQEAAVARDRSDCGSRRQKLKRQLATVAPARSTNAALCPNFERSAKFAHAVFRKRSATISSRRSASPKSTFGACRKLGQASRPATPEIASFGRNFCQLAAAISKNSTNVSMRVLTKSWEKARTKSYSLP